MTPTATPLRSLAAVLAAAALTVTGAVSASAAGSATALNANDLAPGAYATDVISGDFTIHSSSKSVTVDVSDRVSDRGDVFEQRLKLNGSGEAAGRSVSFTTDGATEVVVQALSGSATADRALGLYTADWTLLGTVPAPADDADAPITTATLPVPGAGTFWIASPSSGVNVYALQLGEDEPVARTTWADVEAPVIDAVSLDPVDPSRLFVDYTGVTGVDGADLARAVLLDTDGATVARDLTATREPGRHHDAHAAVVGHLHGPGCANPSGEADAHTSAAVARPISPYRSALPRSAERSRPRWQRVRRL